MLLTQACKKMLNFLPCTCQEEAIVAAAVFATLQPAAAAAAQKNVNTSDESPGTQQSRDETSAGIETDLNADSVALAICILNIYVAIKYAQEA